MTFSIAARSGSGIGVAVASRYFAVGSVVPSARSDVGAFLTQSLGHPAWHQRALGLLGAGSDAQQVLDVLLADDPEARDRQLGVVGARTQACFTGSSCEDWAGDRCGSDEFGGYAICGNTLVGEEVLAEMERVWVSGRHLSLPARLLHALLAGDRSGGDRRGRQSASLYAVRPGAGYGGSGVLADLRVDDHADPVNELQRLLDLHDLYTGGPTNVLPVEGPLAEEVRERLAVTGRETGTRTGDLHGALTDFAAEENLQSRLTADGIDSRVLQVLRERSTPTGPASTSASSHRHPTQPGHVPGHQW